DDNGGTPGYDDCPPGDVLEGFGTDFGDCIGIFAPGEDVALVSNDGSYVFSSGASYSAPIVAGAIALRMQNNPNHTPEQVRNWLYSEATTPPDANIPTFM